MLSCPWPLEYYLWQVRPGILRALVSALGRHLNLPLDHWSDRAFFQVILQGMNLFGIWWLNVPQHILKRITFLGIQVCVECNSGGQGPGCCHMLVTSTLWPLLWAPNVSLTVAFKGRLQFSSLLHRTQWKLWPAHQSPHKEQRAVHVPKALDYNTNLTCTHTHTHTHTHTYITVWF